MNIAVIKIGGVGGYFGGKLTQVSKDDPSVKVYFIARNKHLEAIRAKGLTLDAEEGIVVCKPYLATDSIADLPVLDYCFVCVKGYDLTKVLTQLKDKIRNDTVVLPLLNGVDIHERVRAVLKHGYVHPACVYIATHLEAPGLVKQRGPLSTIHLGKDPLYGFENKTILGILERAGIRHVWREDPFTEIWSKYCFIAPFGLVTAHFNETIPEVFLDAGHLNLARTIMAEVVLLARGKGIPLPETIIEDTILKASKFPAGTRASFQRDVEILDKPDERDLFGGSILRMGKELDIPTPVTEEIFGAIARKKPLK
jgi:2-dehydropantoate 2-reductase